MSQISVALTILGYITLMDQFLKMHKVAHKTKAGVGSLVFSSEGHEEIVKSKANRLMRGLVWGFCCEI